jgi:GntR family phosphonate transport system transcriptional regulator
MRRNSPAAEIARATGSGVALWRRVADEIERGIATDVYRAGTRLPGEIEIAARFGVNRHTIRRALAELAERGLVRAERGSGTYIEAKRISYPIRARTRFSEIVGSSGREAGGTLIASAVEPAQADVAGRLLIARGSPVARLEVLRKADRLPICVATSWLPEQRFADAARIFAAAGSITQVLVNSGVRDYRRSSTRVNAMLASIPDAMHLKLSPGAPLLVVDSVDCDPVGKPVIATRARFAAERVEFVVET